MEKTHENYNMVRELMACQLWLTANAPGGDESLPWRDKVHENVRENFRANAELVMEGLLIAGVILAVPKKVKTMASLRTLMIEPEHLAYELPGVEF